MYKYRINENDQAKAEKFQKGRIDAYSDIEKQLVDVVKTIRQAKIETIAYYRDNPDKFAIVYGTDLIQDYLNDIKILLTPDKDE